MTYDCIVVGSGIAGLSFALKVAAQGHRVIVITKKTRAESATNYAQGGIACVTSQTDDFELHVKDTLDAGDGLCNEAVVREIVREGPSRIQELIELGVAFTQLDDGRPSLGKEGGHSKRRILHVADLTGAAIESALLQACAEHSNIDMCEHYFAIDLIRLSRIDKSIKREENRVIGLYVYDVQQKKVMAIASSVVMLATGGVGHVYQYTTNPDIATGDGIAMAYRARVEIQNMEFIQFHPTAFYTHKDAERFLISEAVRGEGAILRNRAGDAFMQGVHPLADLAPRDVVARAIDAEMKRTGAPHMWLDVSGIGDEAEFSKRFPNIFKTCRAKSINVPAEPIPVVPAAHYLCGGVKTNLDAETSLPGLYTCGEVACTGLHGANRLASNSLLEAVVMAHRGAESVHKYLDTVRKAKRQELPDWIDGDVGDSDERVVLSHNLDELKRTMWDYVGIVRTTRRLARARTRIQTLSREINDYYWNFKVDLPLLELRNLVQVAELIVECAVQRPESRGLHYTLDYNGKSAESVNTTVVRD